jgi:hypothetical protein
MCIANADRDTHANWMIYTRNENRTLKNKPYPAFELA